MFDTHYEKAVHNIAAKYIPAFSDAEGAAYCDFEKMFAFARANPEFRLNLSYVGVASCVAIKDMAILATSTKTTDGYDPIRKVFKDSILSAKQDSLENGIQSNCLKVMSQLLWLNSACTRCTGEPFMRRRFEKTDNGMWYYKDARAMVLAFASATEHYLGKDIFTLYGRKF